MKKSLWIIALTAALGVCGTAISQSPLQVTTGLEGMTDAYLTTLEQQDLSKRHDEIAKIHDKLAIKNRQAYIRKTLMRELGGEWPEKTPLHAQITGVIHHEDYTVQKLVYQSLPHFYVTANVYVPQHAPKPYPAVLGFAGHSGDGKAYSSYQTVWVSLAKRGFLVIAIDPVGQGERLQHLDPVTHKSLLSTGGTAEHMADGLQTLLTGTPIARYFLWDGMRAIDYLESRDDVDKARIGVAGNSGGGTQSAYTATLDSRVAAAVISCYMTSWNTLWAGPGPQDSEQVLDGFLADHLDFPDFLISIAPRPVKMAVATRDFFPIAGAHATFAEGKDIFHLLGVDDKIAMFEADDTHGWSQPRRLATYQWLMRWLQNRPDDGVEAELKLDTPSELSATASGQVITSYPDAETVQSWNAKFAQKLREKPAPKDTRQLATLLRRRLTIPDVVMHPSVEEAGSLTQNGIRIEKIKIQSEAGITVPGLVFHPSKGPSRKHAVLYLNPSGMAADAGENGPIEKLVAEGNLVLAIDPRGWGESAPPNKMNSGYHNDYQVAMRAILVGKSMPGMQTFDALNAFHYLASRPDVDPREISLHTQGIANNVGIFATVLEPKIKSIRCDTPPMSFLAMTELKLNNQPPSIVVPGILQDLDLPDLTKALGSRFQASK
ncbi:alpha/beta hydrolase [Edaphobacter albus]|uniref:alpha/beta hydrolase n=1 Tax=Edaphobacter sp. 4G125 TaxID=2763071 RepID=UPI0016457DF5|nr:acetylxylan esterase [Edaphobacter sp. 4G125]QNI37094.1 acetylxylan esterase [Edaphobacter sp. 4G125]